MSKVKTAPGPNAQGAFQLGIFAAVSVGVAGLGILYFVGRLSLAHLGVSVLLGGPIYLLVVAILLSIWLGYDKDASDLRPVYETRD